MNRWKAALIHLILSLIVIGGIAAATVWIWFPYGLYRVAAPDRLLYLMWGIDLVVGPLLTLVVFRAGKPSLKFDLTVIAICQAAFLFYGLHTLWASRPVFLVASPTRFNLVFANEVDPQALSKASAPEWRRLSWSGPVLVGALPPANERQRQDLLFATLETGIDLHQLPQYYVPYERVARAFLKSGPANPGVRVPLVSSRGEGVMQLNAITGKPETARSREAFKAARQPAPKR